MTLSNRRQYPRQDEETLVQLFVLAGETADSPRPELIPVKMINKSETGLYIETDRAIDPGSHISVKMLEPSRAPIDDAYYLHDGRVVWCKKVDEERSHYGIGVEIIRKVVQAEVPTSRF